MLIKFSSYLPDDIPSDADAERIFVNVPLLIAQSQYAADGKMDKDEYVYFGHYT
jgi:hypothetical protein